MGNRNEDSISQSDPGGNTSGVAITLEPGLQVGALVALEVLEGEP